MVILHIAPINMINPNGLRFSVPGLVSAQNKCLGIKSGLLNVEDADKLIKEEVKNFDFDFYSQLRKIRDRLCLCMAIFSAIYIKRSDTVP